MKIDLGFKEKDTMLANATIQPKVEEEKEVTRYPCLYVRLPKMGDLMAKLGSSGKATIEYEVTGMSKNKGFGDSIELDIKSIDPIGKSSVDASKDSDEAFDDFMKEKKSTKK